MDKESRSKDHVIGRRFLPKGKLNASWNLVVWACKPCNNRKAELENDISAISMHPDAWGRYAKNDPELVSEYLRKSVGCISSNTGRPVADSSENIKLNLAFGGFTLSVNLHAPPQVQSMRLFELVRLQLMGFFYWLTYRRETRRGGYWTGGFFPIEAAMRSNWGNARQMHFMRTVAYWEPRLLTGEELIDGYYKVAIRRHPSVACWSWAVEWNHSVRIIGFFGDEEATAELLSTMPTLGAEVATDTTGGQWSFRPDVPLYSTEDVMFYWSTGGAESDSRNEHPN